MSIPARNSNGVCAICKLPTSLGELIFPFCEDANKRLKVSWAHLTCKDAGTSYIKPHCTKWVKTGQCSPDSCVFDHPPDLCGSQNICKFYITKTCPRGDQCFFKHTDDPIEIADYLKKCEDEKIDKSKKKKVRKDDVHGPADKTRRNEIFSRWVVSTFGGSEKLSNGGIIDVAGGRGELSFELCYRHGVGKLVLVEPRFANMMDRVSNKQRALSERLMKERIERGECTPVIDRQHIKAYFNDQFAIDHPDILKSAAVVLGMHPDGATEYIVDTCVKHNKPFAVIPCCVFPKDPNMKFSFEGWVDHLMSKSKWIKKVKLDFIGRNEVLYYMGENGPAP